MTLLEQITADMTSAMKSQDKFTFQIKGYMPVYNNDFSLSEIAENEGITRQAVRDNLLKGENNLLEYDEKLSMLKKKTRNQNILDDSIEELNSIINNKKIDSEAIKKIKNVIKELKKID